MLLIKKVMYESRMTQAKLAHRADVNQTSLSRIVNGKEPAYPKRGKRIADALGWEGDPADLFKEVEDDD